MCNVHLEHQDRRTIKKYNDAVDRQWADLRPYGCNVTSIAYFKHLNGFVLTDGYLNIWTFPTNQDQKTGQLQSAGENKIFGEKQDIKKTISSYPNKQYSIRKD
jgi:hypothetical protein